MTQAEFVIDVWVLVGNISDYNLGHPNGIPDVVHNRCSSIDLIRTQRIEAGILHGGSDDFVIIAVKRFLEWHKYKAQSVID